ncbi:tail length tape measure protein [Achromobacter phage vB_AxyP_19-32_Axy12]|uniref:Putative tape measure protein n=1 Tax=Achromobacter phage vB_AxyP_19-32_Axy12 TaxID=2591043 RepID=A0A514CUE7_9CAUD|nr:tail length tape measure protein [Achromobacter phage vB_AxyP_19-32_Axy12]QDH84089.1 putative tape measure protein [Achromobacter phage vB_AxyP_19-32_Axy12]
MTTEANTPASDISQMSDEEILNMTAPEVVPQNNSEPTTGKTEEELAAEAQAQADAEAAAAQAEADAQAAEAERLAALEAAEQGKENVEPNTTATQQVENGGKVASTEVDSNGKQVQQDASKPTGQVQEGEGKDKQGEDSPKSNGLPADFDYKAGYEALMAPFKANGKMVQVRNAEEAIALMQQGANFTRKMQELAPHRKLIQMLQNNDLLDEGQLSFAIDLVKKNPEAIKKLVKDSGIDPMDIDVNAEVQYKEGNHRVSDAEVRFNAELGDLKSTPEGNATLGVIHQTWDDASKQALFETAGLMNTIHEQRENGIYDRITSEIEHLKTLGKIDANVPFIQAYKAVGDFLQQQGAFADLVQKNSAAPAATAPAVAKAEVAPVATRVLTPKPVVKNGEQASAASPSRNAPRKAEALVNLLGMSDEDFLKLPVPKGA